VELDRDSLADVVVRLNRVQGQLRGIVAMIDDGRDCKEIITQLAAASRALDRAGFKIIAAGLEQCLTAEQSGSADTQVDRKELEKLFLTLA
jgi:DNA-binding FrmR family transcriptional regulator